MISKGRMPETLGTNISGTKPFYDKTRLGLLPYCYLVAGNHLRVLLAILTNINITGTSTSTPTTVANAASLWLLQRTKSKEAHIQASVIFSANDVIVNIGVIVAGLLVGLLNSNAPDLIIGIIVFLIVIRGAIRILKLSK